MYLCGESRKETRSGRDRPRHREGGTGHGAGGYGVISEKEWDGGDERYTWRWSVQGVGEGLMKEGRIKLRGKRRGEAEGRVRTLEEGGRELPRRCIWQMLAGMDVYDVRHTTLSPLG